MREVKWEKCVCHGAIGTYPPKSGKMLNPYDQVIPDMMVSATYKGLNVYLKITREIQEGIFVATVLFFEPVLSKNLDDLNQTDEVKINREHICWLHEN
jgi:hypothetical protein